MTNVCSDYYSVYHANIYIIYQLNYIKRQHELTLYVDDTTQVKSTVWMLITWKYKENIAALWRNNNTNVVKRTLN